MTCSVDPLPTRSHTRRVQASVRCQFQRLPRQSAIPRPSRGLLRYMSYSWDPVCPPSGRLRARARFFAWNHTVQYTVSHVRHGGTRYDSPGMTLINFNLRTSGHCRGL